MTYGPPPLQDSTCPARLFMKAVGRTMLYEMSPALCSASSNLSFAFWKVSSGFCTQMALSSTKCFAPCARVQRWERP